VGATEGYGKVAERAGTRTGVRVLRFDPASGDATVARTALLPPKEHEVEIRVGRVLLSPYQWDHQKMPHVPGGAIAGRVVAGGVEATFAPGTRVVTIMPRGACAERVCLPSSAVFDLDDHVSDEHGVMTVQPGLRAWYALEDLQQMGVDSFAVLGAAGPTGSMIGALAAERGHEAHAITSTVDPGALRDVGFRSLQHVDGYDADSFARAMEAAGPQAIVSCLHSRPLAIALHERFPDVPWLTFPDQPQALPEGHSVHVVDVVRRATLDIDAVASHFDHVAGLLTTDRIRVPTTRLTFADIPNRSSIEARSRPGALILDPTAT
jgi:NADPH:quinone reductase-like Zn-dependent oxidoreductase